jgi:hypothetical protein
MIDITWTIPGTVVRGYDGTTKEAKLFKLTDADRKQPRISFFWVDAADGRTVLARFHLKSGGVAQVAFDFDVKCPTVSDFTGNTGENHIEESHGMKEIWFGILIKAPGIKWIWKITMPSTHAGYIKDVQTVLNDRSRIMFLKPGGKDTRKLVWRHPKKTDPHMQLDDDDEGQAIYTPGLSEEKREAGTSFTDKGSSDSPHTSLPSLAKTVSVSDQFTYYIMFKPATNKPQDAIWVPVARAKWFWKAVATQEEKKWRVRPELKMEPVSI